MGMRCPFPACECTHHICVAGWIDYTDKGGRDRAIPCRQCRPEVSAALRSIWHTRDQAQARLRGGGRSRRR
ncbi:hypothetical protein AB0F17_28760 [Nonomuraea sp. NPDC026600]|uniref:hypothetical protein n=1 Tax=Nonomuraea sp. NPDC026600 TaxID=3155363 RepID=UPI0033BFD497